MSSNFSSVSYLPLHVFQNLISHQRSTQGCAITDPHELRKEIVGRLQKAGNATGNILRDAATNPLLDARNYGSKSTKPTAMVKELLKTHPTTLLRILDPLLTYSECKVFLDRVHKECASVAVSALMIMQQQHSPIDEDENYENANSPRLSHPTRPNFPHWKIPSGLPTLDAHLRGGFPLGSLSELVGRAGVGKTQLAQQLCVMAAMQGIGGSIYIDTEKKMNLIRLREIADGMNDKAKPKMEDHQSTRQVLENVTVQSLLTTEELMTALDVLTKEIVHRNAQASDFGNRKRRRLVGSDFSTEANPNLTRRLPLPVRLVVIDSIAAPIRRDFDLAQSSTISTSSLSPSSSSLASKRASALFQISRKLKQLGHDHKLAIVVVNQVGGGGAKRQDGKIDSIGPVKNMDFNDGEFTATLGAAWQYCVSTRIVLEHQNDPHKLRYDSGIYQCSGHSGSTRTATIAKSLISRNASLSFELSGRGLSEVAPSY